MHSKQQSTFYGTGVEESNANEGTVSKSYYSAASQIGKEKASRTSSNKGRSSQKNALGPGSGSKHKKTGSIDELKALIALKSSGSCLNSS